jgi:hypothetical protein
VFAALAEFIRELIIEGTHEGLAAAKARGVSRSAIYEYVPELKPTGLQRVKTGVPDPPPPLTEHSQAPSDLHQSQPERHWNEKSR